MKYQILSRKWRPKTFEDVVGQEHIIKILTNGLKLNRIHQVYLLSGTRGIGKTTLARLFAKGLNCKIGITDKPCRKCNHCLEIEHNKFIDVIEIDAASKTKVEDIKELLDNMKYAPIYGRFKVYIIDEIHMLSKYSFNALLKILEEPPKHVQFLLATTDYHKLPITILSRCIHLQLKIIDPDKIEKQLIKILKYENITADLEAIKLISNYANGSLRDALSITDQTITAGEGLIKTNNVKIMLGINNISQSFKLFEILVSNNSIKLIEQINLCANYHIDWDLLLIEILSLINKVLINKILNNNTYYTNSKDQMYLNKLSSILSEYELQLYYKNILIGRKELPYAPNKKMGVEMILLRILKIHEEKKNIEF